MILATVKGERDVSLTTLFGKAGKELKALVETTTKKASPYVADLLN